MHNPKEILNEVLKNIKPSEQEQSQLNKVIADVLSRINKNLKNAKAILGGSGAKNTYLRNATDIDIYVKFNYNKFKDKSDKISLILEKHLKKIFKKIELLHGSRDYFQIKQNNFTFEIVPILDIKNSSQAKNITDVSQLHVNYVKKFTKLADEIRLAKQFCKANNCYGAESYIQGFSGYVLELLVIHYKSFLNLIKAASKWKEKTLIGNKKQIENLNISKKHSPVIIIDSTQKDRNASAALSKEKYNLFIQSSKNFLKNPGKTFFEEKFSLEKKPNSIIINIIPEKGKRDVIGARLLKLFNCLQSQLKSNDIKILESRWNFKENAFFYIQYESPKTDYTIHYGPYLNQKDHIKAFKSKYKHVFIKNNRIAAKIKREFTPINLLKSMLKQSNFRKLYKVKDFNIL